MRKTYRIYALNTLTGRNAEYIAWLFEAELEQQIKALQNVGYNSIVCYDLGIES